MLSCGCAQSQTELTMHVLIVVLLGLLAAPVFSAEKSDVPDAVFPQKLTASKLMVYCASSSMTATGRLRQRYCDGFISGIEEGVRVLTLTSRLEASPSLCVPANVSSQQIRSAFVKNSANMERSKDKPAAMFTIEVLERAFPCR